MKSLHFFLLFLLVSNFFLTTSAKIKDQPNSIENLALSQVEMQMLQDMEIDVNVSISLMMIIQMLIANGQEIDMESLSQIVAKTDVTAKSANQVLARVVSQSGAEDIISAEEMNQCADNVEAVLTHPEKAAVEFINALPDEVKGDLTKEEINQIAQNTKNDTSVGQLMDQIANATNNQNSQQNTQDLIQIASNAASQAAETITSQTKQIKEEMLNSKEGKDIVNTIKGELNNITDDQAASIIAIAQTFTQDDSQLADDVVDKVQQKAKEKGKKVSKSGIDNIHRKIKGIRGRRRGPWGKKKFDKGTDLAKGCAPDDLVCKKLKRLAKIKNDLIDLGYDGPEVQGGDCQCDEIKDLEKRVAALENDQ